MLMWKLVDDKAMATTWNGSLRWSPGACHMCGCFGSVQASVVFWMALEQIFPKIFLMFMLALNCSDPKGARPRCFGCRLSRGLSERVPIMSPALFLGILNGRLCDVRRGPTEIHEAYEALCQNIIGERVREVEEYLIRENPFVVHSLQASFQRYPVERRSGFPALPPVQVDVLAAPKAGGPHQTKAPPPPPGQVLATTKAGPAAPKAWAPQTHPKASPPAPGTAAPGAVAEVVVPAETIPPKPTGPPPASSVWPDDLRPEAPASIGLRADRSPSASCSVTGRPFPYWCQWGPKKKSAKTSSSKRQDPYQRDVGSHAFRFTMEWNMPVAPKRTFRGKLLAYTGDIHLSAIHGPARYGKQQPGQFHVKVRRNYPWAMPRCACKRTWRQEPPSRMRVRVLMPR